jgi:hypothetical protein
MRNKTLTGQATRKRRLAGRPSRVKIRTRDFSRLDPEQGGGLDAWEKLRGLHLWRSC